MVKESAGSRRLTRHYSANVLRSLKISLLGSSVGLLVAIAHWMTAGVQAQTNNSGSITLRSDIQEANAVTGVITARGNVQIDYPAQQIYATSSQAQFFNEERRIILSGDVVVLQEGNRLEAETVTYLIDEGRFVALPQPNEQVQTTYILPASEEPAAEPESESNPQAVPVDGETPLNEPIEPDATLEISPIDAANTTP
ncbi:MAG: LptA/OstA family protein [Leptolyngbyaceae cyanobacterium]